MVRRRLGGAHTTPLCGLRARMRPVRRPIKSFESQGEQLHTRSCRYQRAPGTEAPALSKHYRARVASTAPRQTPLRRSMAARELALPGAAGAPEQRDAGWLERGVTRVNVALLVLGLLAVKAFLGH